MSIIKSQITDTLALGAQSRPQCYELSYFKIRFDTQYLENVVCGETAFFQRDQWDRAKSSGTLSVD